MSKHDPRPSTASKVVDLSDLTPEQKARLREQLAAEDGTVAAAAADPDEGVYTNITRRRQIVADLGKRLGDRFIPESIKPRTTVDLKRRYKLREIRSSDCLRKMCDVEENPKAPLRKGRVPIPDMVEDPLAARARLNPEGTFSDPRFGERPYDVKLRELEDEREKECGPFKSRLTKRV